MIIGITGKKFSGKDTLADELVLNHNFIKYSMADPLKDALKALFGFTDEQLYGNQKEIIDTRWKITPREVMQFFGTQVMQYKIQELIPDLERNFFVKRFEDFCKKNKDKNIVVADIRFQHEINSIKKLNGYIIRVTRDNLNNNLSEHISESGLEALINVDYIVKNNSSKQEAFLILKKILENI